MLNKDNFRNKEIHLYAINEGTGHIRRIFQIAEYLSKFYKNIFIGIWNPDNKNIKPFFNQNYQYSIFNSVKELCIPMSNHNIYYIILDIRDFDPYAIIKIYDKVEKKILCLDNHNKKKDSIEYIISLPHPDVDLPISNILKNNFWNFDFISSYNRYNFNKENTIKRVLVYLGIPTSHSYADFLLKEKKIRFLLNTLKLNEIDTITYIYKDHFFTPEVFYSMLINIDIVITYPGILFYESMLLNKRIIGFHFESKIHLKILEKIIKDCNDNFKDTFKIYDESKLYEFFYFDFRNYLNFKDFNLWTPYERLKNWIES
jgi:hypothetical protein